MYDSVYDDLRMPMRALLRTGTTYSEDSGRQWGSQHYDRGRESVLWSWEGCRQHCDRGRCRQHGKYVPELPILEGWRGDGLVDGEREREKAALGPAHRLLRDCYVTPSALGQHTSGKYTPDNFKLPGFYYGRSGGGGLLLPF